MTINLFKAARRIALALGVTWVGGCVAYGFFAQPHAYLTYSVSALGAAPARADKCGFDDDMRDISTKDSAGNAVGVRLCFKSLKTKDSQWWRGASYAPEVVRQMDAFEESFQLPLQGMDEAQRMRQEQRVEQRTYAAMAAAAGSIAIWVLTLVVGWGARVILRIPRGQDSGPTWPRRASTRQHSHDKTAEHASRAKRRTRTYKTRLD
jgi:hypothetical protein